MNVSLGGRILVLIKSDYHGWLSMMTSSEGPFLVLPRAPPNHKHTTGCWYFVSTFVPLQYSLRVPTITYTL